MKRVGLLTVVTLLGLTGTAVATPRLTLHHGRQAIAQSIRRDVELRVASSGSVDSCWREGRARVACWTTEHDFQSDWTPGPGELRLIVTAILRHGRTVLEFG